MRCTVMIEDHFAQIKLNDLSGFFVRNATYILLKEIVYQTAIRINISLLSYIGTTFHYFILFHMNLMIRKDIAEVFSGDFECLEKYFPSRIHLFTKCTVLMSYIVAI